ncbi:protein-L-isoaspartate O-methyltransferase [Cypionkella aquatica]|uniref:Protein-L-isoaspartate O-methyltransferase n=1 Tax=Cypionkella aquatica TaxID=1756042 RepID=A0AA37X0G2_9RHOB|nr:protein-L-isoaspartate O-methyltransferase [Cypionkella aquatica]GLS87903.1 protein-L-isoaspartate O-methyltransferase [Cypionkella aquatica]
MSDFSARRVTMVDTQVRPSDVTKFPIIAAMLSVQREAYVPHSKIEAAYVGENIEIGAGRVMVEARTLAKMLDALDVQPTDRALYIAGGLGYGAAVLARMVASVVMVEADAGLAGAAQGSLGGQGVGNVSVVTGALEAGSAGSYDIILIEGGVHDVPEALLSQLAEGGRIAAIYMQGPLGSVKIGHKADGRVSWRFAFNATAPVLAGFAKAPAFAL